MPAATGFQAPQSGDHLVQGHVCGDQADDAAVAQDRGGVGDHEGVTAPGVEVGVGPDAAFFRQGAGGPGLLQVGVGLALQVHLVDLAVLPADVGDEGPTRPASIEQGHAEALGLLRLLEGPPQQGFDRLLAQLFIHGQDAGKVLGGLARQREEVVDQGRLELGCVDRIAPHLLQEGGPAVAVALE